MMLQQTFRGYIHRLGSVHLRHLGETLRLPPFSSDGILLMCLACRFFLLLLKLVIRDTQVSAKEKDDAAQIGPDQEGDNR